MAGEINGNKGIDFINSVLKGLGLQDTKVNSSDVASIFSAAEDKNNNGVIDKDEFTEAIAEYYKADIENLSDIEDSYMDAWNDFSGIDGNNTGISSSDISGMNAQVSDSLANSDLNYANSENYTAPTKQNTKTPTVSAVSTDSLSGKSSADLTAERSDLLSQLDDLRTQKEDNSEVNAKKEEVAGLKQAYDEALANLENDEVLEGQEKSLNDLKADKEEKEGQIQNQNEVISGLKDSIDSQHTLIDSLNSELGSLTAPSEGDYKTTVTDEDGNTHEEVDTEAYNAAVKEYEAQKAELEANIAEAENVLAELEENLASAEDALNALEEEAAAIDANILEVTQQIAETEADDGPAKAVQEALEAYNKGQADLEELEEAQTAQLDADINQLQENLSSYDEAIATAEAKEAEEAKAAETEQKAQLGLTDDERIQLDDEGNAFVEVTPWQSEGNGNDCLSRIMANNYDYEALGIEPGSEEYNKLQDALMDANPEIYGSDDVEGRNQLFGGGRENSVIYAGDKITLPDAYEVLGLDKPVKPTPVTSTYGVEGKSTPTYNEDGTVASETIEYEDGTSETIEYSYNEDGKKTGSGVRKDASGNDVTTYKTEYDDDGNMTSKEGEWLNSDGTTQVNYRWEYNNDENTATLKKWGGSSDPDTTEENANVYDVKFDENGKEIERTQTIKDENGEVVEIKYFDNIGRFISSTEVEPEDNQNPDTEEDPVETDVWGAEIEEGTKAYEYLESLQDFANTDGCNINSENAQTFFKGKINEALNDPEVTPQQKMKLLAEMNDISSDIVKDMAEWEGLNNEFVDILEESVNSGDYNVDQIIELNNQYKALTGQTDEEYLGFGVVSNDMNMPPMDRYIDTIVSLYDGASSEDKAKLNEEFNIGSIIQSYYSHGTETEKLKTLFNNMQSNPEEFLNAYAESNPNAIENWNAQYGEPGKKAFQNVMEGIDNFSSDESKAAALLNACGGSMDTLVDYFRKYSSSNQEKYLDTLLNIFAGSSAEAITASGNQSQTEEPANTVENPNIPSGTKAHDYLDSLTSYANTDGCDVTSSKAQAYFKETLNEALNDPEVTVQQKMELLNSMNEISADILKDMAEYEGLNNEYVDILEEAVKNGDCSVDDIIKLDTQYKALTGQTDEEYLGFGVVSNDMNMPPIDRYIDTIVSLYNNASAEDIQKLNERFNIGSIIQSYYSHGTETEKLKTLFNNIESNPQNVLNQYLSEHKNAADNWNAEYGNPGKNAFKNIMKNLDNFSTTEGAVAALLNACNGNMDTLVDYFRDYNSSNQEKYLPILLELFGGSYFEN